MLFLEPWYLEELCPPLLLEFELANTNFNTIKLILPNYKVITLRFKFEERTNSVGFSKSLVHHI